MIAFAIGAAVVPPTPCWFSRQTATATFGAVGRREGDERGRVHAVDAGLGRAGLARHRDAGDLGRGAGAAD